MVLLEFFEELLQKPADVQLAQRDPLELRDVFGDVGSEGVRLGYHRVDLAEAEDRADDPVDIVADDAIKDIGQVVGHLRVEVAGHAAIDEGDSAVRRQK